MVLPVRARTVVVVMMVVSVITIAMLVMRTPVVIAPVIMRLPPVVVAPAAAIPVMPAIVPIANLQFYRRYESNFRCLYRHGGDQHQRKRDECRF